MSELPEIESIVYFLKPHLIGKKVSKITLKKESILVNCSKEELVNGITNHRIVDFSRNGKILSFLFDNESRLYIHPRMVGQLITCPKNMPEIKHTHFLMELDSGEEFRYIDVRRLGKFYYIEKNGSNSITGVNKLGLEYNDKKLSDEYLKSKFLNYRKAIKDALLDQSIVAGIGNIYADEILFSAKILPSKKAVCLGNKEINNLLIFIKETLEKYIKINETAGYDRYLKGEGKEFENMHVLRLYKNKTCPVCNSLLERVKISSRGTVYCSNCQK